MKMSDKSFQENSERMFDKVEKPFIRMLEDEKNRYVTASENDFLQVGRLTEQEFLKHRMNLANIIKMFGGKAVGLYGRVVRDDLIPKLGKKQIDPMSIVETNTFFDRLANTWFSMFAAEKVVGIAETTRSDIARAILNAEANNLNDVVQSIRGVKDFSLGRSRTIARTEVHSASMFASMRVAEQIGVENDFTPKKRWLPAQDERTRVAHGAMINHPPIPLSSDFTVGGEKLSRPSDPRGSAGNVINCRCVLVYDAE